MTSHVQLPKETPPNMSIHPTHTHTQNNASKLQPMPVTAPRAAACHEPCVGQDRQLETPFWGTVDNGTYSPCPLGSERTVHSSSVSNYLIFFNGLMVFYPYPSLKVLWEGWCPAPLQAPTQSEQAEFCMYLLMLVTSN